MDVTKDNAISCKKHHYQLAIVLLALGMSIINCYLSEKSSNDSNIYASST